MNFQSNYPRGLADAIGPADVVGLRRSATIGQVSLIVLAAVSLISLAFPRLPEFEENTSLPVVLFSILISLAMFIAGVVAIGCTMFWVTRAHRAVCKLREISPRIPSQILGFLSGIPYHLFFLPLSYAVDFLMIRSESPDKQTMRWYSMLSKSPIVNTFAVALITDTSLSAYEVIKSSLLSAPESTTTSVTDIVSTVSLLVGIVTGIRIAKTVNDNVEKQVTQSHALK